MFQCWVTQAAWLCPISGSCPNSSTLTPHLQPHLQMLTNHRGYTLTHLQMGTNKSGHTLGHVWIWMLTDQRGYIFPLSSAGDQQVTCDSSPGLKSHRTQAVPSSSSHDDRTRDVRGRAFSSGAGRGEDKNPRGGGGQKST